MQKQDIHLAVGFILLLLGIVLFAYEIELEPKTHRPISYALVFLGSTMAFYSFDYSIIKNTSIAYLLSSLTTVLVFGTYYFVRTKLFDDLGSIVTVVTVGRLIPTMVVAFLKVILDIEG